MSGFLREGLELGDRYVVRKKLGTGGMAIVWLVEEKKTKERYAVKEPILSGRQEEVERNIKLVEHEGHVLSLFQHMNICRIYNIFNAKFQNRQSIFLLLEYLDGGSLKERGGKLSLREVKEIVFQILEGLAVVHLTGVVHRDIKPSNVMAKSGVYKLIDFGTAIRLHDRALFTVLSPGGYTAPEQARGFALPQSDVWSVGATTLYLLTGEHPCRLIRGYGCNGELMGKIEILIPTVDDSTLYNFLKKSLEPDYRLRFFDAKDALDFLKGLSAKKREGLALRIKAREVEINTGRVILARTDDAKRDLTLEGEVLYIYDEKMYISRRHAEIIETGGKWYLRDLGSTNKTAVYRNGIWQIVWSGRGATSQWAELYDGDIIALGYDEEKGPYLVAFVKI